MALSIGGLRPMNYALSNASSFSDAYVNSVKQNEPASTLGNIGAVIPVAYPNAEVVDPDKAVEQMRKSQTANRAFNDVASGFSGSSTGYNSSSSSYGYEMLGSTFDMFA